MRHNKNFSKKLTLKSSITSILNVVSLIGLLLLLTLSVRVNFVFEIFATYMPQLVIGSLGLFLFSLALVHKVAIEEGWKVIFKDAKTRTLTSMIIVGVFVASLYISYTQPVRAIVDDSVKENFSVMTFNKLYSNDNYQQIINHIHLEDPDIIAFQEIYKNEAKLLATELGYENWHIAECTCSAYGSDLAIMSRFPILNTQMAFEDTLGGALRAEIELGHNDVVTVYSVHIIPPYKQKHYGLRGDMFMKLSESVSEETNPTIVMGDFNASPQAIDLRRFAAGEHKLNMVAEQTPWSKCSWFGFGTLFCARIDHIFIPEGATATFQTISSKIGSDHRAVHAGIKL